MKYLSDVFRATPHGAVPLAPAMSTWLEEKSKQNETALLVLATSAAQRPASTADVDARPGPLIAVVDDEVVIAITLAELLNRHGFRAVWFTSPLCALDFLKRVPIDLLLSDIQMPGLNGLELSTRLAGICAECPVLLMSGNSDLVEKIASSRALKQNVFLAQKPIGVDRLVETLRRLLPAASSVTSQKSRSKAVCWRSPGAVPG